MPINYKPVEWDTTKYVNPTNMNQMDNGIKAACDGVDALTEEVTEVNESLGKKQIDTYVNLDDIGMGISNTVEEIMVALPMYSILQVQINEASIGSALYNSLPITGTGILELQKGNNANRGFCIYRTNIGEICESGFKNGKINGWFRVATNSDLAPFIGLKIAYGQWNPSFTAIEEKQTDIDISSYGFTQTPIVSASIVGQGYTGSYHAQVGQSETTAKKIRLSAKADITANNTNVRVNWVAIGI